MYQIKSRIDNIKQCAGLNRKAKGENNVIETPEWLCQKIKDFIINNPTKDLIYNHNLAILDPCCGVNYNLTKFLKNSELECKLSHKMGFSPYNCSNELAIEKTITNLDIVYGQDFFKYSIDNKFDIIVMNAPFTRDKKGKNCWNWVIKCMEHLNKDGLLISILPNYILFNSDNRKKWLDKHLFYLGVLPKMTFGFPLHTLVAGFRKDKEGPIQFGFIFKE